MINDFFIPTDSQKSDFFNWQNMHGSPDELVLKQGIGIIIASESHFSLLSGIFKNYKNHFKNISIYDFGILRDQVSVEELIQNFNHKGILPFFIGSQNLFIAKYAEKYHKSIFHFSNTINQINTDVQVSKQEYIGYQRHLCTYEDIAEIESYHQNSMSLGKMRTYTYLCEPILRDANLVLFDTNVYRASDCPENPECLPTGMNAEEVCQIFRYLGTSSDLKAVFIDDQKITMKSAHLLAESFWYFAEGFNMKSTDHPSQDQEFSEFIVDNDSHEEITFVKNNRTQRWWVKNTTDVEALFMACAFEEYQACVQNDVPERLQSFLF